MSPTDGTNPPNTAADDAAVAARRREVADGGVMSFGEHLEELRRCSIRALLGLLATVCLSLVFAKRILAFIVRPALVVLEAQGQRPELQALSPPDTFIMYLKMALISGVILAMPWILMQIWRFVGLGLYSHEKRFIRKLTPVSIGLFASGVVFMFYLVLPVVLNFFVTFTQDIRVEDLQMSTLQSWIVGDRKAGDGADVLPKDAPTIPVIHGAPADIGTGGIWFDASRNRLCVRGPDEVYALPLQSAHNVPAIRNYFSLAQYVGFVLTLSLGFGIAFELPLAILFITAIGVASPDQLAHYRKHIILVIFFLAAVLTPPDVMSQMLLAIPMLALFEGSLIAARRMARAKAQRAAAVP